MACSVRLLDVKKLPIEAAKYLLEVITKCYVGQFSKTFNVMIQKERVKQISSGVEMGGYPLSILVKINYMVNYISLPITPCALQVHSMFQPQV